MLILAGLSQWLFGPKPHPTGLILGNDAAGKTTMMYQLKLGTTITTIPTIGFNVETIERGKRGDFTFWDIGGCDQMRALIRHYFRPERFILFLHDCTDFDRLEDSIAQLHAAIGLMIEYGTKHIWIMLTKQDLIPMEDRQTTVDMLRTRFESEVAIYIGTPHVMIVDKLGLSALDNEKLHEALDEIKMILDEEGQSHSRLPQEGQDTSHHPTKESLLQKAEAASAQEPDPDTFWQAFLDGSLDAWDHYAHLRSGYFVMLEALTSGTGILECADTFLKHLARLRAGNPQRFKNTAHRTMTVFWLAQIQLAVLSFAEAEDKSTLLERKDFRDVVLHSPSLMDSGLWKAYYSKDLLFGPDARENWRFPDLQPLPAFVANPLQQQSVSWVPEQSQDRLIRFALIVTQASMSSKVRRGALVKRALQALETSTIRARGYDQRVPPYSETQSYFWIQIVHACLLSLEAGHIDSAGSAGGSKLATRISLPAFKSMFRITGEEWRNYYTEKTWSSVAARREFALPDLKPLPNVIDVPTEYSEKKVEQGSGLGVSLDELSRNEVIATMVAMAMSEEAEIEDGQVTT